MSVLVGALVALALLGVTGPPRRRLRTPAAGALAVGSVVRARRRTPRRPDADLAGLLHAVAAQLRAGAVPPDAWTHVLGTVVDGPAPDVPTLAAAVGANAGASPRVRAVVAGTRVAAETGAPLADVLDDLAAAVAADAEHAAEVTAALAGPRATARLLVALPLLGLVVGAAMGARPWEVLADGRLGTGLGLAGVALVAAGRAWVGALLRRAAPP